MACWFARVVERSPFSKSLMVLRDTPDSSAKALRLIPSPERAARHCKPEIIYNLNSD